MFIDCSSNIYGKQVKQNLKREHLMLHLKYINTFVRCCIYLTTYDWIKSFLKITIERRAIYGNLENKINTLYLARRKFHS